MAQSAPATGYIINKWVDLVFLIGSPLIALALGFLAATERLSLLSVLIVLSPAHLFLVIYRSHGNKKVFDEYPFRFTVVPIALFLAIFFSHTLFRLLFFVTLIWDVHHSTMQTFGIGRIYDAKKGNDAQAGRKLDMGFNILMYVGPIIGGVSVFTYINQFKTFDVVETLFFTNTVPIFFENFHPQVTWVVLGIAAVGTAGYLFKYWQLTKQGYKVSPQKVALFGVTALVSIWAWGFNPVGQGFFIINIFHALQYFALIWWAERKPLTQRLGLEGRPRGLMIALIVVMLPTILFGIVTMSLMQSDPQGWTIARAGLCAVIVVETMHYWYDGFIWSVRKKEVPGIPGSQEAA